jgi:hypothetical protein
MNVLPKELSYLDKVASALAQIPQNQIDEDVDLGVLEAVLRERIEGMKLRDAISRLTEDRAILERWLQQSGDSGGPAFMISRYMMRPGPLARKLLEPPPAPASELTMKTPDGWSVKTFSGALETNNGKLACSIVLHDKAGFDDARWSAKHREELQRGPKNPWANLGIWSSQSAKYGACHGEKFHYVQTGKVNWKSVEYALEVPGGFVHIRLSHASGKDFDETEIERELQTLNVIPPTVPPVSCR